MLAQEMAEEGKRMSWSKLLAVLSVVACGH